MNEARTRQHEEAVNLAFDALGRAVETLAEARSDDGPQENSRSTEFTIANRDFFEQLAGLAHAGLTLVESNREWFLAEGLPGGSYGFWYTLALTVNEGPPHPIDRSPQDRVPEEPIRILFGSLLRFFPYACVQAGDCAVRTADALAILYRAFPLDGLYELTQDAVHSTSFSAALFSAVADKVEEHFRALRRPDLA